MPVEEVATPDGNVDLAYAIVSSVGEGVLALDVGGRVTFVNPAAERLLGGSAGELLGKPVEDLVQPLNSRSSATTIDLRENPRTPGTGMWAEDAVVVRADGTSVPVARTVTPLLRGSEMVGSVVSFRDISHRRALEEQLIERAFHDELTGLANRGLFLDRLSHAHSRALRRETLYAVMFIDLDGFKAVNDTLGHDGGDQALVAVARVIQLSARPSDTAARFGGDEFAVLLEDLAATQDAETVARRLLAHLDTPLDVHGMRVSIGASIGVAISDGHLVGPQECLRNADLAMYRAKGSGKGRYEMAHPPEGTS